MAPALRQQPGAGIASWGLTMHPQSTIDRFWSKVQRTATCWRWIAGCNARGYGKFGIGGKYGGWVFAHRFAWELHYGAVPDGLFVLHRCQGGGNPACVNPAHLYLGTKADNARDAADALHNWRQRTARLTSAQVLEARADFAAGRVTARALCDRWGMALSHVYRVLHGERYKRV